MFYSLSVVLFFDLKVLPAKPLGCSIFVSVSAGHAHFSNNKVHISWVPFWPSTAFSAVRMPEKLARKAGLKVCGQLLY